MHPRLCSEHHLSSLGPEQPKRQRGARRCLVGWLGRGQAAAGADIAAGACGGRGEGCPWMGEAVRNVNMTSAADWSPSAS